MLRIFGHSDDCIEVEGSVTDEFYVREGRSFLRFDKNRTSSPQSFCMGDDGFMPPHVAVHRRGHHQRAA